MKRTTPTSLSLLLSGNQNKKAKLDKKTTTKRKLKSTEKSSVSTNAPANDESSSTSNDIIDLLDDEESQRKDVSPQEKPKVIRHIIPEGGSVKAQSVKSFLLSKKPAEQKTKNTSDAKEVKTGKHITSESNKSDNNSITQVIDDEISEIIEDDAPQVIDNGKPQIIDDNSLKIINEVRSKNIVDKSINLQRSKLANNSSDIKKTKLKDLFSRFGPPVGDSITSDYHGPKSRFHQISKLNEIEAPFPHQQLVQPIETVPPSNSDSNINLPLRSASPNTNTTHSYPHFNEEEYISLNHNRESDTSEINSKEVNYTISQNKYFVQWPELFKPKTSRHVILEQKVREGVATWIETAINKLKRPTTRNKLLSTYKEDIDMFKKFIIHDDEDDQSTSMDGDVNNGDIEEFVPLAILHGDGVGKNTLIHTIAKEKNCQIYEVNTSQNRGRKDIFDTLSEYCTTHFVKDKKVPGVVVFSDVDVVFKEHDRFFWSMIEKLLLKSRKPIILTCDDINFVPTTLINICSDQESIFQAKKVTTRTVVAYLEKYCQTLELKLERSILEMIARRNNRDIRKCLMQMQFWFSSEHKIRMDSSNSARSKMVDITDIRELSQLTNLYSMGDIIASNTVEKSQILQEDDHTLMTNDVINATRQSTDDQYRMRHDYMEDYRIHVPHYSHSMMMPFELNIGSKLLEEVSQRTPHFEMANYKYPHKFNRIKSETVAFLETRIKSPNKLMNKRIRGTRNSRKMRSILKNFEGVLPEQSQVNNDVMFDFATTNTNNLGQDVLPYAYEIALHEQKSRQYNCQLYQVSVNGLEDEEQRTEMLNQLIEEEMFKQLRYEKRPDGVVKAWE
ncbi:Elg1 protein [Maudiozyma humilis]|uniref:Elg1 protein n=1 Tax=Maudiozyma humilis TaxID=51915 RepID=A0AAV5RSC0_MAUHU|nr:Elg1 protein [Kazachstania humilis]